MTITEEARHRLYLRLEEVLGTEEATTIMEHLPPVGWADVATKRDLDQLATATKRDIDQLATATKRDIEQLATATKRDIDHLGEVLRLEFKADLHRELRLNTYAILGGVSVIVAAAQAISHLA